MRVHSRLLPIACAALVSALAAADGSQGQELFQRRCTGCHSLDRDMEGPRLRGVYGRHAAAVPHFPYSDALKRRPLTWDSSTLEKWLTDPDALVPGNNMGFRVQNAAERAEIIRYLEQASGDSKPVSH